MITIGNFELEAWCNGPLPGTVWARLATGEFYVVRLAARGKENEIVDYVPPPKVTALPVKALDLAREIVHREWRWMIHQDPYLSEVMGRLTDRDIVRPEPAQLEAAREVIRLWDLSAEARWAYHLGHVATNAVGEARLLELLRQTVEEGEEPCSETTYSSATE